MSTELTKTDQEQRQAIVATQREEWIKSLRQEDHPFDALSEQEKELVTRSYAQMRNSFLSSIAMVCNTETCPLLDSCPYYAIAKAPEGSRCPIETDLLALHIGKYAEEYNVDVNMPTERDLLIDLAECIIYENRATQLLAHAADASIAITQQRFTQQGDPYEEKIIHPAVLVKEKMKMRRMKIIESFIGTRKEKAKVIKRTKGDDYSNTLASARKRIEAQMAVFKQTAVEAEFVDIKEEKDEKPEAKVQKEKGRKEVKRPKIKKVEKD